MEFSTPAQPRAYAARTRSETRPWSSSPQPCSRAYPGTQSSTHAAVTRARKPRPTGTPTLISSSSA
eukprot:3600826-Prymnesium_polylepis.1